MPTAVCSSSLSRVPAPLFAEHASKGSFHHACSQTRGLRSTSDQLTAEYRQLRNGAGSCMWSRGSTCILSPTAHARFFKLHHTRALCFTRDLPHTRSSKIAHRGRWRLWPRHRGRGSGGGAPCDARACYVNPSWRNECTSTKEGHAAGTRLAS